MVHPHAALALVVTLLPLAAAAQPAVPVTSGTPGKFVVGVSWVSVLDWEVRVVPGRETYNSAWSDGVEVFVGRDLFMAGVGPVALELPLTYVPKVRQAPQDPVFDDLGVQPDSELKALYFVPRLRVAYPAAKRWQVVAAFGFGVARFSETSDARARGETGYPLSMDLGLGMRLGPRWAIRVGYGGFAHVRATERSCYMLNGSVVRRF